MAENRHRSAYFDGRGGRTTHAGRIWDCAHARCVEWVARLNHDSTAAAATDRVVIGERAR